MLEGLSLGIYLLLVDYTGRLFREGKAVISAELDAILERLGSSAENWQARLQKLSGGQLLGRFFAATRSRLREVAQRLGVHRLANLAGARHAEAGRNRKSPFTARSALGYTSEPIAVSALRKSVLGKATKSCRFSHLRRIHRPFILTTIARDDRFSER